MNSTELFEVSYAQNHREKFRIGCWYLLIVSTIVVYVYNKWRRLHFIRMVNKFDGPRTLPFIGNLSLFWGSSTGIFEKLCELSNDFKGRAFRIWFWDTPYIVLDNPDDIKKAASILERDTVQKYFSDLIGHGILTADPEKWKSNRRAMCAAFDTTTLSTEFLAIFNKHSNLIVEKFKELMKTEDEFDVYPHILHASVHMILETMFGSGMKFDAERLSKFGLDLVDGTILISKRMSRPWLYPNIIFKAYLYTKGLGNLFQEIKDFHNKLIEERVKLIRQSEQKNNVRVRRKSMVDMLLTNRIASTHFSEEDLRSELLTLLIAGSESNALTISFTLLMLAMHPDAQDRIYEELCDKFGDEVDIEPDANNFKDLPYLEQCIKETLRKFSVLPVVVRRACEDITLSDNMVIPSGASVTLPFNRIHNNPDIYPDPEQWNPANFDPDKVAERPSNSFMPFGAGPHMCIGYKYAMLTVKAVVSKIVRNYKLTTSQTQVEIKPDILLRSKNGYFLKLHPR